MSRWSCLVAVLLLPACGGSSSETPWPREPDNVDLGPAGEREAEEAPFRAGEAPSGSQPASADGPAAPAR